MRELPTWRDVVEKPLPVQARITEAVRDHTIEHTGRFRGSVRLSTGSFWTTEDYERSRQEILDTPLP